jgi:hypothetical protein
VELGGGQVGSASATAVVSSMGVGSAARAGSVVSGAGVVSSTKAAPSAGCSGCSSRLEEATGGALAQERANRREESSNKERGILAARRI